MEKEEEEKKEEGEEAWEAEPGIWGYRLPERAAAFEKVRKGLAKEKGLSFCLVISLSLSLSLSFSLSRHPSFFFSCPLSLSLSFSLVTSPSLSNPLSLIPSRRRRRRRRRGPSCRA